MHGQRRNGFSDCRQVPLDQDMFAIVFTMGMAGRVERIESFMPPYEGLAPHVYLFVSQLAMMSSDDDFVNRILTQAFDRKFSGMPVSPVTVRGGETTESCYQTLRLTENQIALIIRANRGHDTVRQAWLTMPSFNSDNIACYLFVEYLCQQCMNREFFQKMVFDGFNRNLFVNGPDTSRLRKHREYTHPVWIAENQIGLVFLLDGRQDIVNHVVTIVPGKIDRLSDVYVTLRSLSILAGQEYFFKKVLLHGFQQLTANQSFQVVQRTAPSFSSGTGQTVMLSQRQAALICTIDTKKDRLVEAVPALSSVTGESLRSCLFVFALADILGRYIRGQQNIGQGLQAGLSILSGS